VEKCHFLQHICPSGHFAKLKACKALGLVGLGKCTLEVIIRKINVENRRRSTSNPQTKELFLDNFQGYLLMLLFRLPQMSVATSE
jgi:hypothetical protein